MIQLKPMSEDEFREYLEWAIADYANDHIKAQNWSEEDALEKSREEYTSLLPDGVKTKNHYLYRVMDMDKRQKVGMIWLNARTDAPGPTGFIYDILIDEPFRRQGYGTQTMLAVEEKARGLGLKSIGLHVFGHNRIAIKFYDKVGYQITNLIMKKDIS